MRKMFSVAMAASIALAACSGEAEESVAETDEAPATAEADDTQSEVAEAEVAEDAAPVELATADVLASDYHGVWDVRGAGCDPMSDGRLEITADQLRFHESVGDITEIERQANGNRLVTAAMQGEGETWDAQFLLEMDSSGRYLVITAPEEGVAEGVARERCEG